MSDLRYQCASCGGYDRLVWLAPVEIDGRVQWVHKFGCEPTRPTRKER